MLQVIHNLFQRYLDKTASGQRINTEEFIYLANDFLNQQDLRSKEHRNLSIRLAQILSVIAVLEDSHIKGHSIQQALDFWQAQQLMSSPEARFLSLYKKDNTTEMARLIAKHWWRYPLDTLRGDERNNTSLLIKNTHEDNDLKVRFNNLDNCPIGSLGKAFYTNINKQQYKTPGCKGGSNMNLIGPHDSLHILTGLSTNIDGEILLGAYCMGMSYAKGFWNAVTSILEFKLGYNLFVKKSRSKIDTKPVNLEAWFNAYLSGMNMKVDMLDSSWDFWSVSNVAITKLRKKYNVKMLSA